MTDDTQTPTGSSGIAAVIGRDADALAVLTTVVAAVVWFAGTAPDTTTRIVSTLLAAVAALAAATIGLAALRR